MSVCQCQGIETLFNDRVARKDLKRYRKKGPLKTTRILLEALRIQGVQGATLLDIGGGVGAVSNGLLDAGAAKGTVVDASPAYLRAAQDEASRQGHLERIEYHSADFVEASPQVEPADIVTLDRVICCYDDMPALVSASVSKAERLYGLVYPRDTWWDRAGASLLNFGCWAWRTPFRIFIHPPAAVEQIILDSGLQRCFRDTTTLWQVVVYARV